jgi:uncharacterized protein (TIGR03067 family)
MKRFAIAGSALLLTVAGVLLADEKDLKELEGTYSVTSLEKAGGPASKELTQKMKLMIKGDNLSILVGDEEKKAKITADASKQPNNLDISPIEGPEKGKTFLGIYKTEKGELTIAFSEKGARPKEFKTEGEVMLLKLKKDEKK